MERKDNLIPAYYVTEEEVTNVRRQNEQRWDESARAPEACYRCGSSTHRVKNCSTAKRCFHCKFPGHMARDCPYLTDEQRKWRDGNFFYQN